MNRERIANKARKLQYEIWSHRGQFWPNEEVKPLDCLRPEVACQLLGYEYGSITEFGDPRFTRGRIIGELDRVNRRVTVAGDLPFAEQRFTAAHELGHIVLHGHYRDLDMHRERPSFGPDRTRDPREREAEYFAGCFLMPAKILCEEFAKRFGRKLPLHINDDLACRLSNNNDPDSLLRAPQKSLDRELAVARYEGGNGRFKSLADRFGVSAKAMAIRIKELGLVKWP